ncbi:MAG: Intracellular exo-alpha-L-arabinofuranosidase 2 [Candidatus Ordinivivax streblomastigis]|uniref:non-reducing end alpha-L-arabinofuranosidase n=1 Tax=Candidatus Ordinivivax streblomastigis TaxID=2540710 RepID=A0A5M8NXV3_9BACT|nr:MAG: Intracellular exo-alpha-L-arabinofuranosidase 2 [Candidatus Ordinivivax streblomastigis]
MKRTFLVSMAIFGLSLPIFAQNKLVVNADQGKETISKHIYGHFSEHLGHCIYGGYWVGEDSPIPNTRGIRNDIVKALKDIQIPNLRWPGGCFADEYHWMDGIGPRDQRPQMVNTHWGGVTEDNSFGTHEFLDLCEQLSCEPYISGNLGSGSTEEMSKWVEYITFDGESPMSKLRKQNGREKPWKVKFWGVGNESWGCGGNMTPDYYSDQYRRYATYCRNYGDNRLYKIACGANEADYNWTETVMKNVGNRMQGLSLHYYTITKNWGDKGSATQFDEAEYFTTIRKTLFMDELLTKHANIMDRYDPQKRVGLITDEWGAWYNVEPRTNPGFLYQQNTLRDAILAGINLNIFNAHCDRVKMTNIAQTVNVLQAVILTDKEKMLLTPTYWVYYLYKVHQDATLLPVSFTCNPYELNGQKMDAVSVSASKDASDKIHITLVNIDPNKEQTIETELRGTSVKNVSGKILTSGKINDYNSFENLNAVSVKDFSGAKLSKGLLSVTLPAKSVVMIELN